MTRREDEMDIDHEYTKHMICPYCGYKQRDVWEFIGNNEDGDTDCGGCDKPFRWSVHRTETYTTKKQEPITPAACGERK